MRHRISALCVFAVIASAPLPLEVSAQARLEELAWAYAISPTFPAEPETGERHSLPGSDGAFTRTEISNRFGPADWFPGDHPDMPPIVATGREAAAIWACSLCHYPNGKGRPENAGVAGLPRDYFIQQMRDFAAGLRRSANVEKANTNYMIAFGQTMTDAEIEAYIATGDPFDKAGGYAIQHPEFAPVARIEGSQTNVIGLPLETLRAALDEVGWVTESVSK